MNDPRAVGFFLWLFTWLIIARVVGQLVVALYAPRWLPPMHQWQSGLLPYPGLLAGQFVVVTLMAWISADFSRGAGFWLEPRPRLGVAAVWWSYLYFGAMAVRYIIRMVAKLRLKPPSKESQLPSGSASLLVARPPERPRLRQLLRLGSRKTCFNCHHSGLRRCLGRPDQRWFGGTIPIVFHCVVATFQWTFGTWLRGSIG